MLSGLLALLVGLELGKVAVVVTLHLEVEHLGLALGGGGDQVVIEQGQDVGTDLGELGLDLQLRIRSIVSDKALGKQVLIRGCNDLHTVFWSARLIALIHVQYGYCSFRATKTLIDE